MLKVLNLVVIMETLSFGTVMNKYIKDHPYISGILIPPLLYFIALGLVVICLLADYYSIALNMDFLAVFLPLVALVLISIFNIYVIAIAKGYRKRLIIFFIASLIFLFCLYYYVYIHTTMMAIENMRNMQMQGVD